MKRDLSTVERLRLWGALEETVMFLPTATRMSVDDEATEALIKEKTTLVRHRRSSYELVVPWSLAIIFFCSTLFFALRDSVATREKLGSFESGFSTDFGIFSHLKWNLTYMKSVSSSPRIPLRIIKKRFTNDLLYNTTSQRFYNQPLSADETIYVGEPTAAINEAWRRLLHAQYISLEPEETIQFPPSHIAPIWWDGPHNFMELSIFHNLHCLNEIRLALDHEDDSHSDEDWMNQDRTHLDHCIDQIRQALECQSDLTPVPMKPIEGGPRGAALGNGEEHTCRDFDAIWAWVEERGMKNKALGE